MWVVWGKSLAWVTETSRQSQGRHANLRRTRWVNPRLPVPRMLCLGCFLSISLPRSIRQTKWMHVSFSWPYSLLRWLIFLWWFAPAACLSDAEPMWTLTLLLFFALHLPHLPSRWQQLLPKQQLDWSQPKRAGVEPHNARTWEWEMNCINKDLHFDLQTDGYPDRRKQLARFLAFPRTFSLWLH